MSATVGKGFYRMRSGEQTSLSSTSSSQGLKCFPLKPLAGLLCSFLRGLYRSLAVKVGSESPCAWDILVLEPSKKKNHADVCSASARLFTCD